MTRFLAILSFLFLAFHASGQMGDYISLKQPNNRTVATYFKGSKIALQRVNGQQIEGYVEMIKNDSVFIREWDIRTYYTQLGVQSIDTFGYFIHSMHYMEIFKIFPARKESWRFVKNGTIFMIAGFGYAILNVVNGAYLDEPITDSENLKSLGIALGVAGFGFTLNRIEHSKKKKGKKYKIVYVRMTDGKPALN
ncbi:hypothetical protein KJS94_13245 [Flavihumibacter rivuli]|uniref:hypothetical protein n=1 Tax=Flavihumibacter rivuli TaxID=2838156 RepID=UPI001BDF0860|nr:hypothetical protein [Flavihumibacter rivuli]ULQ55611.1 hypothetical protein KJS94_13245 [Flavihumibacter rivuli]